MSEVWEFLKAVGKRWKAGLTGGALVASLVIIQATGHSVSPWFYGMIVVVTLFSAFFMVWREESRRRRDVEAGLLSPREKDLLKGCCTLKDQFVELMRRFPKSPSLENPFGKTWRPLVGDTTFGEDVKEMMSWHKNCENLLNELEPVVGPDHFRRLRIVRMIHDPTSYMGRLDWLKSLHEIEELLLRKTTK